jgi:hypothetical protein
MPQPNYSIIFCLIFLGLAVLVRTVAIGQRAYDLLLPPTLADDPAPALDAVASGHTAEPLTKIDTGAVAVVNAPSFEDTRSDVAAENEAPPAKPEIPRQIASERWRRRERLATARDTATVTIAADFNLSGGRRSGK